MNAAIMAINVTFSEYTTGLVVNVAREARRAVRLFRIPFHYLRLNREVEHNHGSYFLRHSAYTVSFKRNIICAHDSAVTRLTYGASLAVYLLLLKTSDCGEAENTMIEVC